MGGGTFVADRIDRVTPRARPAGPALMRQNWHHLLFLHWEVEPEKLRALLPPGLDLDLYEGKAYVGLTPFTMTGVRPVGVPPVPFVSSFHETNVRTYVHVGGRDPGVWFFSLEAASTLAVVAARTLLGLPYRRARIEMDVERRGPGEAPVIRYRLRRRWPTLAPAACAVRYAPRGPAVFAPLGSLEYFLAERYVVYSAVRGRLYRGRVHHAPWPLQGAELFAWDETLLAADGVTRPHTPPLAHYGREARVEVFGPERVGPAGGTGGAG